MPHSQKKTNLVQSPICYVTMMYGSQDIKMENIWDLILFFVHRGTSPGLELTLIINHLGVKILFVHKTCCESVVNYQITVMGCTVDVTHQT